jgi:hypothetical protein
MTRSPEEEKALHHLGYEWWMFRSTHAIVTGLERDDDPVRNALVESLVIHGRNLIDFFYIRPVKDDLVADHVRCKQQSSIPEAVKGWRDQAHKRVAHLTETRFANYDAWKADEVRSELEKRIDEVRAAMGPDMPEDWKGDTGTGTKYNLRSPPDRPSAGAVGGAVSPPGGTGTGGAVGATGTAPLTIGDVPGTTTSRIVVLDTGRK